mgnify:CR=1 FL=1
MLELYSIDVIEFDTLIGNECDLTDDVAFSDLLARAQAGEFFAALSGTLGSDFLRTPIGELSPVGIM